MGVLSGPHFIFVGSILFFQSASLKIFRISSLSSRVFFFCLEYGSPFIGSLQRYHPFFYTLRFPSGSLLFLHTSLGFFLSFYPFFHTLSGFHPFPRFFLTSLGCVLYHHDFSILPRFFTVYYGSSHS